MTWIFDLDNTLHNAEAKIFPLINIKINQYIGKKLKIDEDSSDKLRQRYWDLYGATLQGLIENHRINPEDFLEKTHTLKNFSSYVIPMKKLKEVLSSINDHKIIYTNDIKIKRTARIFFVDPMPDEFLFCLEHDYGYFLNISL